MDNQNIVKPSDLIWILSDRYVSADDNCEHFYRYLKNKHPEIQLYYLIDKNAIDYNRLQDEGFNLIQRGTDEFNKILEQEHILISSHYVKEWKENTLKVFIPHGITLGDSSRFFNKGKFDLCTSCVQGEYDSYTSGEYNYKFDKDIFKLTGMPRHDSLIEKINSRPKNNERTISFAFTWRKRRIAFFYFKVLNRLFSNPYLKKLSDGGIKFQIKIHPRFLVEFPNDNKFKLPSFIKNCGVEMSYQDFICNTDLMISDYSSACQEFSLTNRNIIYYQFDKSLFLREHSIHLYNKGWFDWDNDALGYICLTEKSLIRQIKEIVDRDFAVEDEYLNRMNNFFKFHDTNNCQRVYDEIVKLIDNKYNKKGE